MDKNLQFSPVCVTQWSSFWKIDGKKPRMQFCSNNITSFFSHMRKTTIANLLLQPPGNIASWNICIYILEVSQIAIVFQFGPNWPSKFTDEQLWFMIIIMTWIFKFWRIRVFLTHFASFLTTQLMWIFKVPHRLLLTFFLNFLDILLSMIMSFYS